MHIFWSHYANTVSESAVSGFFFISQCVSGWAVRVLAVPPGHHDACRQEAFPATVLFPGIADFRHMRIISKVTCVWLITVTADHCQLRLGFFSRSVVIKTQRPISFTWSAPHNNISDGFTLICYHHSAFKLSRGRYFSPRTDGCVTAHHFSVLFIIHKGEKCLFLATTHCAHSVYWKVQVNR